MTAYNLHHRYERHQKKLLFNDSNQVGILVSRIATVKLAQQRNSTRDNTKSRYDIKCVLFIS